MKKLIAILLTLAVTVAAVPFIAASADDAGGNVTVKTGRNTYLVSEGEVIEYVYYLNFNDKITSLEAELSYDTQGLELIVDIAGYDEEYEAYAALFPTIKDIVVINYDVPGSMAYNLSRPAGTKSFNKNTSVLIRAAFKVTASQGVYEINNDIAELSGLDEHRYIYQGEQVDAIDRFEGVLTEKTPQAPPATEKPTSPTSPTSSPEDPTKPTEEPQAPTQEPTVAPTEEPHAQEPTFDPYRNVTIKAGAAEYLAHPGDVIEYTYYLNTGEKLCSLDGEFTYTAKGLVPVYEDEDEYEDEAEAVASWFPVIGGAVVVSDPVPGYFAYNYSHPKGKNFNKNDSELMTAVFRVTGYSEICIIENVLHTVAGAEERRFIYSDEVLEPLKFSGFTISGAELIGGAEPTAAPTEAPTAAPEAPTSAQPASQPSTRPGSQTEPQEPTEAESSSDLLLLKVDGVEYRVYPGEIIEYAYYLNVGGRMCSLQADLFYPSEALQLIYDEDIDEIFTFDVVSNEYVLGNIKYNYSNTRGKNFNTNSSAIIMAQFRVIADKGTYEINHLIDTIAGPSEHIFMRDMEVIDPPRYMGSELIGKKPYDPADPDPETVPPTEPVTEPVTEPATEPADDLIVDEETGVAVKTTLDVQLTVDEIDPADFFYFVGNSSKIRLFKISLTKDGEPADLDETVKLLVPSSENGALFTMIHTTTTDLGSLDLGAEYSGGALALDTDRFGLFILSEDGEAPELVQYGDVDLDNEITIIDATFIQRRLAGLEKFTEQQDIIGGVDTDGELSILDATHIQRWLAGLENELERFGYPKS